jgi:hypothetical protein
VTFLKRKSRVVASSTHSINFVAYLSAFKWKCRYCTVFLLFCARQFGEKNKISKGEEEEEVCLQSLNNKNLHKKMFKSLASSESAIARRPHIASS